MKKNLLAQTCIGIAIIIVLGFCVTISANCLTFRKVSNQSIENIARLTSSTIYAEIANDLTKPIYVSQTMANDTFLKEWMHGEATNQEGQYYSLRLQEYLKALRDKYKYDSVFVVSAQSKIYYHFQGINKQISEENKHDVWYYDFVKSGLDYDLDVDTDEAAGDELTVFVNCRIEDDDGALLGVVGVGVKMSQIQELLRQYEKDFELQAFLVNPNGDVQVHTNSSKIERDNFFKDSTLSNYKDNIINDITDMQVFWYPQDQLDHCLITRYVHDLDWYLVVEKNTAPLVNTFHSLIFNDTLIAMGILLLLVLLCINLVRRYDRIMMRMATTDELTGLPNRKWFGQILSRYEKGKRESFLFVLDIDRFKAINDNKGHQFGDQVLREVANLLKETFATPSIVARWGGDEFIGIFESDKSGVDDKWQILLQKLADNQENRNWPVDVSMGVTAYEPGKELDFLLGQADQALYNAKTMQNSALVYYE